MSWTEKGKVISVAKNLVVRIRFGRLITFKNTDHYKKNDSITLTRTKSGKISILKCEHVATSNQPPKPPTPKNVNYNELEYLEDLE